MNDRHGAGDMLLDEYGDWYKREDVDAELARLRQRIADLEAAKPVATVLATQIDDVAEATADYPIPSSMDVRRHPITQCLIAAIVDNARLRERCTNADELLNAKMEDVRAALLQGSARCACYHCGAIVERESTPPHWKVCEAHPAHHAAVEYERNIANLETRQRELLGELARPQERERELLLHNTRFREREREVYNRLDRCLAFLRPRTVVPQMYREDEHE